MASRCFIFMYFLLPHCVPATWRSRAQTSISSAADAVHPSDPFHLVLGFQSFGYALGFLHLLDRPVGYCTCNCAHFLQVGIQRSLKQHAGIEPRFVIPEDFFSSTLPKCRSVDAPGLSDLEADTLPPADMCRLLPQKLFA